MLSLSVRGVIKLPCQLQNVFQDPVFLVFGLRESNGFDVIRFRPIVIDGVIWSCTIPRKLLIKMTC